MRSYEHRNNQSQNHCSYCREPGHNASSCPHVASDWAFWSRMEVPLKDPNHWTHSTHQRGGMARHWYLLPRYWSEWYTACEAAMTKQLAANERKRQPSTRRQSKCGFCGGLDHNRRKCAELLVFRQKANVANQAFRRFIYDEMVTKNGLSAGALVEVSYNQLGREIKTVSLGVCTVVGINWDNISITSDYKWRSPDNVSTELMGDIKLKYVTGSGEMREMSLWPYSLVGQPSRRVNFIPWIEQVISPSPMPLDEAWVKDGKQDAYDWLSSKRSLEWLRSKKIVALVDKWYAIHQEQQG